MTNPNGTGVQEACPLCGALKRDAAEVKCSFCGAILRAPEPDPASTYKPYLKTVRRQYVWTYVFVGVVMAIGIAVQVFRTSALSKSIAAKSSTAAKPSAPTQSLSLAISDAIVTLARADGGSDVLATTSNRELVRVDGRTTKLRWKSEALGQNLREERILVGGDAAYVVDETRVVAVSLVDGKTTWQTPLVTEVSYGGKDALMLAKTTVLVLEKDGSLQAFDRSTGVPVWNEKLEYRPSTLPRAGSTVLILRAEKQKRQYTVDLVDAASGKVNRTLRISHRDSVFHSLTTPDAQSKFLFSEDGREMYVVYGFLDLCVERWDLSATTVAWQYRNKGTHSSDSFFLSDQALLVFSGQEVRAIARANGVAQTLLVDKDNTFKPLAGQGGVVVLIATPNWDSNRATLWGVDAGTGKQLWSAALPKQGDLRTSVGKHAVRMTPHGLAVVQVVADREIGVDLFDLKTGVSRGRKIVRTEWEPSQLRIADDGGHAWVGGGGKLFFIDLATGKLMYHFE